MLRVILIRSFLLGILLMFIGLVYGVTEGERGNESGMLTAGKVAIVGGMVLGVSILVVMVYMLYCIMQVIF